METVTEKKQPTEKQIAARENFANLHKKKEEAVIEKPTSVVVLPNDGLDLGQFNYRKLLGEDFEKYQAIVKTLQQRKLYDWVQYNAVGIWNRYRDPVSGQMKFGGILMGIQLVNTEPINYPRVEARHVENWAIDRNGDEHMGGLNAQIYDKANNRANSRYYLLRQPTKPE
jgi:hypothetical protein